MLSYAQTEPSSDLLNGSTWATTVEGTQNFPDFPDNGSAHSGDAEEYIFSSGHTTPRGSRLDRSVLNHAWNAPRNPSSSLPLGGQAMSRADSSKSQTSHLSRVDMRGNISAFRNGPHTTNSMVGLDSCLLLDADATATTSNLYWNHYPMSMPPLNTEAVSFHLSTDISSLHVVPAQMQLGPDASLADNSSPSSWDCFSSSISRTSSPATTDETWISGPHSPNSSPELQGQSPRYVESKGEPPSYCP